MCNLICIELGQFSLVFFKIYFLGRILRIIQESPKTQLPAQNLKYLKTLQHQSNKKNIDGFR